MLPNLDFRVNSAGITLVVFLAGVLGMGIIAGKRRRRFSLTGIQVAIFTICVAIIGFAGVKLLYILESWPDVLRGEPIGMSFFGAVYLIPAVMPFVGKKFRLDTFETLDLCAPCGAFTVGVMRFSCFFAGCCGGITANLFGRAVPLPVQLFEAVGDFAITYGLIQAEKDGILKGKLYPACLISYGILRFCLEFIRETEKGWAGLSHGHWFSVVGIVMALTMLAYQKRKLQCQKKRK